MEHLLAQNKINKRKIFYLSGYDPRGIRFYYQNLKLALEKFCQRDSLTINLSKKEKISNLQTQCMFQNKTHNVTTEYCFLHWDDIIKQSWIKSFRDLFMIGLKTYTDIFSHLSWKRTVQLPHAPIITLFYPFLTLILFPLIMTCIGMAFYNNFMMPFVYFIVASLVWIYYLPRLNSIWLLRFFIFNNSNFVHYNLDYDTRAKAFADMITHSFAQDYDEILLIAHSNGSIASMPILNYLHDMPAHFKVVTLGHCTPLITMNTASKAYIDIVKKVSQKKFQWFDIGFPPDGACYAKTNPFHSYDYNNEVIDVDFKSVSPQFFKYYTIENYKSLCKDKFKLHFSYLCTHDKKSPFEFIDILTSDTPLEIRFNHVKS